MSFAFGFGGDDIENDDDNDDLVRQIENCNMNDVSLIPPRRHTLQELLCSLPSQISYNLLPIEEQRNEDNTGYKILLPRRSVFDIRAQLMAEANPEENANDTLLSGLERGDLTTGIYEGGFKTWECSLDLASLVAGLSPDGNLHIIELGAGSAVPSLAMLHKALTRKMPRPVHFTLCDYNDDVLRLATAPNVFLAGEAVTNSEYAQNLDDLEVEDIDEDRIVRRLQLFETARITFNFVSGAWGEIFIPFVAADGSAALNQYQSTLILASETIYSPKSTVAFAGTIMQLLRRDPQRTKAWIAAKKVYFGVGGGVDDFVNQIAKLGGLVRTMLDVQGAGVGRVVLEVIVEV